MIIALAALLLPGLLSAAYILVFPDPPWSQAIFAASRLAYFVLPLAWVRLADRAPWPRPRLKQDGLLLGVASGLVIGLAALLAYRLVFAPLLPVAAVRARAVQLGLGDSFLLFSVFLLLNSALEEYYWRWFGFTKLRAAWGRRAGIILSGAGFALHHLLVLGACFGLGFGLFLAGCVAVGGWLWCWFYDRYDSIWPALASHFLIDAAVLPIAYALFFTA